MSSFLQRLLAHPAREAPVTAVTAPTALTPWLPSHVGEFIREEDVSAGKLLSLFKQAFFAVEARPDDCLLVTAEGGMSLHVRVDTGRKLLMFSACFELQAAAPMEGKLAFVNVANDTVIFVRFSITDETTLYVDYHLPFNGGVTPAAVIAAVRHMGRVTPQAINELAAPGLF